MLKILVSCLVAFCSALASTPSMAQSNTTPVEARDSSLYRAFGETSGLVKLMDDFMGRLVADPRTKPFFEKANQQRIKEKLVEQLCQLSGGPCPYTGVDMKHSHADLDITKGNFNALVEDLQLAMDSQGIPFGAQNRMLALLAPMHRDVISAK